MGHRGGPVSGQRGDPLRRAAAGFAPGQLLLTGPGKRDISIFAVEKGTPGFTVGRQLDQTGWRLTETARRLGISRTTLWRRMRDWDLKPVNGQTPDE